MSQRLSSKTTLEDKIDLLVEGFLGGKKEEALDCCLFLNKLMSAQKFARLLLAKKGDQVLKKLLEYMNSNTTEATLVSVGVINNVVTTHP